MDDEKSEGRCYGDRKIGFVPMWESFLTQLEEQLGRETVSRWIRPLKLLRFDAANIELEAADMFQIAWFEEHVRPICRKWVNHNGRPIRVHLVCPKKEKPTPFAKLSPPESPISPDPLDPEMTLDNFLSSCKANQIARNLIAEGSPFNPLMLYGPPYSGKTHLLMAAAARFSALGKKTWFIRASTFADHVVNGLRTGTMQSVRSAYRRLDALLVDDIHLLARKDATQEEFFHTFNELHTRGCPILLTSRFPPSQLKEIEPRLISRFEWGISVALEKEEWAPILEQKANSWKIPIEPSLSSFLIEKFPSSPLIALQALAIRVKETSRIDPQIAAVLLKDLLEKETAQALSPETYIKAIAAHFGVRSADILGKSQAREAAFPRQIAMYLCREKLKLPFQKIGEVFGRDHSTVMASVKQVQDGVGQQKGELCAAIRAIVEKVRAK